MVRAWIVPATVLLMAVPAWAGKIRFSADHEASLARAKKEGKPVVLFFTADW